MKHPDFRQSMKKMENLATLDSVFLCGNNNLGLRIASSYRQVGLQLFRASQFFIGFLIGFDSLIYIIQQNLMFVTSGFNWI